MEAPIEKEGQFLLFRTKNSVLNKAWTKAAAYLVFVFTLSSPGFVAAQPAASVLAPNPERQGIPSIPREQVVPKETEHKNPPAQHLGLPDQILPSAIRRIDLPTTRFSEEIGRILNPFIGKSRISGAELEQARGDIWNLYRQHGRFTRVELLPVAASEDDGGSVLQARIHEIGVRSIIVEEERGTTLKQELLDDILAATKADIAEGGILDLDRLDDRIKRRLFLGDINVRATLMPADPDHVDVKVLVSAKALMPLGLLAQYDNQGSKTYGRNRYTAGISIPGRMLAGDQLDAIGLTTDRMTFGRLVYEFPVAAVGVRATAWGSYVDYRADSGQKGFASQLGAGLIRPLYFSSTATWIGYLNYINKHQEDSLADKTIIGDKRSNNLQAKVDANYFLSPTQSLRFNTTLMRGDLDLSSSPSALAQDRLSANTNGAFTKLEWGGSWNALFGQGGALDARLEAKGQLASRNLDQGEKLSLGGAQGVRAYGPSEGLGDEGVVANTEIGYRPVDGVRVFGFYDVGQIRRYKQPWMVETIPPKYSLQGAGVGVGVSYKSMVGSLTYARQIGGNPGLLPGGVDSEGSRDRYRLWLSLTFRL